MKSEKSRSDLAAKNSAGTSTSKEEVKQVEGKGMGMGNWRWICEW